ncbi:NEDD4 family-interacting protein 1-like isoform X2 [Gigantopelta aegis]|uniref:NEDD4 family-interacting protein 1-like isoform X2 n=1 Tax=Gigantopelta aegis TaxID=1735272 RepID=UPI001B887989|nr:NEDD4 family-interacting protein 1-like isoform X2 [Gigantopelta aegis]
MDRGIRYEVLQGEEEQQPAEPVAMAVVMPPPAYNEEQMQQTEYTNYGDTKLPSYTDATNLPSYEEAERTKLEMERLREEEAEVEQQTTSPATEHLTEMSIGTDGMFICTFVIAFLFNWIGFLLSLCISNTVAGRCGALAGLGLSIVKWVAIVKHNNWAKDFASGDSWVWWILVICGFMLFIRGSVQYVRVKYEWNRFKVQLRQYHLI